MKILFLIIIAFLTSSPSEEVEFPKIDDMFRSLSVDTRGMANVSGPPGVVVRNIDINLETLNMSQFREKMKQYSGLFNGTVSVSEDSNWLQKENNTRRLAWIGNWPEWHLASRTQVRNKLYDLMLQLIYMARHKIKQIENDKYFNPEDTSYRIAFLYRKLIRIVNKMRALLQTMKNEEKKKPYDDGPKRWGLYRFLILHHKAARLHVDFLYLWWVLVRLDDRYRHRHFMLYTTPNPGKYVDNIKG